LTLLNLLNSLLDLLQHLLKPLYRLLHPLRKRRGPAGRRCICGRNCNGGRKPVAVAWRGRGSPCIAAVQKDRQPKKSGYRNSLIHYSQRIAKNRGRQNLSLILAPIF